MCSDLNHRQRATNIQQKNTVLFIKNNELIHTKVLWIKINPTKITTKTIRKLIFKIR